MLAPLKDRSVLECDTDGASVDQAAESGAPFRPAVEAARDLHRLLKESRTRLLRGARESTKRIAALNNEVSGLSALCATYRQQLADYESGAAIIDMGRKLMQLSEKNDALNSGMHRMWTLERTIEAAHAEFEALHVEYARLSRERDALAQELCLSKLEQRALVRS